MKLYRVVIQASDIERAAKFYSELLAMWGERVSKGRHYFDCGGTILACFDPRADGDGFDASPNPDHFYIAVKDLEAVFERAKRAGCARLDPKTATMPWGERMFYGADPFGNRFAFVDEATVSRGGRFVD